MAITSSRRSALGPPPRSVLSSDQRLRTKDLTVALSNQAFLEMRNITKSFTGVLALDGVTFDLHKGEIHALVGENGAGKSTLIKVLAGVYPLPLYEGDILINGEEQHFS